MDSYAAVKTNSRDLHVANIAKSQKCNAEEKQKFAELHMLDDGIVVKFSTRQCSLVTDESGNKV